MNDAVGGRGGAYHHIAQLEYSLLLSEGQSLSTIVGCQLCSLRETAVREYQVGGTASSEKVEYRLRHLVHPYNAHHLVA